MPERSGAEDALELVYSNRPYIDTSTSKTLQTYRHYSAQGSFVPMVVSVLDIQESIGAFESRINLRSGNLFPSDKVELLSFLRRQVRL